MNRTSHISKGIIVLLLSFDLFNTADAGAVTRAGITSVTAMEANAWFVYVDQAPTNTAACGTQTASGKRFAVDPTTPGGKAMIATFLTAFSTGRKVNIYGRGEYPQNFTDFCNVWPDSESVNHVDTVP